jgi:hypothetical protein
MRSCNPYLYPLVWQYFFDIYDWAIFILIGPVIRYFIDGDNCQFMSEMIIFMIFFTATKTVLDIKIDVSMLTNIPVSKQVWRGWPESIADELSLAQIGISKKHKLYVKPKDDTSRNVSDYN